MDGPACTWQVSLRESDRVRQGPTATTTTAGRRPDHVSLRQVGAGGRGASKRSSPALWLPLLSVPAHASCAEPTHGFAVEAVRGGVSPIMGDVRASPCAESMTPKLADYIKAGKALGADERLDAAHQLLLSVDRDADADQADIDAAWDEVIHRRIREIVGGTARLVDGREAHARVRAEDAALRQ